MGSFNTLLHRRIHENYNRGVDVETLANVYGVPRVAIESCLKLPINLRKHQEPCHLDSGFLVSPGGSVTGPGGSVLAQWEVRGDVVVNVKRHSHERSWVALKTVVARAYFGEPPEGFNWIKFLDGDRSNHFYLNLAYANRHGSLVDQVSVDRIREMRRQVGLGANLKVIAERYGISMKQLKMILRRGIL